MRKTSCAVLLLTSLAASSCIGPNNAFNGVESWNSRATESKFLNELIYLGLWFIPVYPISFMLDTIVFNSFEFWGGENPIGKPTEYTSQGKK